MKKVVALEIANAGVMHGLEVEFVDLSDSGRGGAVRGKKSIGQFAAAVAYAVLHPRNVARYQDTGAKPSEGEREMMRREILEAVKDVYVSNVLNEDKMTYSFFVE